MKLTNSKLKQLIKEAIQKLMASPTIQMHHDEYREIVANQYADYFSEDGADFIRTYNTIVGRAHKVGSWKSFKLSGSIFVNEKVIFVLRDDGGKSYATPRTVKQGQYTKSGDYIPPKEIILPITKKFNEATFMGLEEGRKR